MLSVPHFLFPAITRHQDVVSIYCRSIFWNPAFFLQFFNANFACNKEDFRDSTMLNAIGGFNRYVDIGGRE